MRLGGRTFIALLVSWVVLACGRRRSAAGASGKDTTVTKSVGDSSAADKKVATPVTMAVVSARTIEVTVSGTGEIDALEDERVRAPFNGLLTDLSVNIGDRVVAGQTVGSMVAENSDAAVRGARSMVSSARTPAQRAAADEALRVAEANIVHAPLRVAKTGVVIARPASAGERLAQGDSVISIGVTGLMVFFADVSQGDLALVRAGERARVILAARRGWIPGVVTAVMPADTGSTATMRVRIDLAQSSSSVTVGLFGTAVIVVAQHENTPAVPKPALLRDDITGITQVAVVGKDSVAHWVQVKPGIADSSWVEILSPRLPIGERVITTGQVGLPDSTPVVAAADTSEGGGSPRGGSGSAAGVGGAGPPNTQRRGAAPGASSTASRGAGAARAASGAAAANAGGSGTATRTAQPAASPSPTASPPRTSGSSPQPQPAARTPPGGRAGGPPATKARGKSPA